MFNRITEKGRFFYGIMTFTMVALTSFFYFVLDIKEVSVVWFPAMFAYMFLMEILIPGGFFDNRLKDKPTIPTETVYISKVMQEIQTFYNLIKEKAPGKFGTHLDFKQWAERVFNIEGGFTGDMSNGTFEYTALRSGKTRNLGDGKVGYVVRLYNLRHDAQFDILEVGFVKETGETRYCQVIASHTDVGIQEPFIPASILLITQLPFFQKTT